VVPGTTWSLATYRILTGGTAPAGRRRARAHAAEEHHVQLQEPRERVAGGELEAGGRARRSGPARAPWLPPPRRPRRRARALIQPQQQVLDHGLEEDVVVAPLGHAQAGLRAQRLEVLVAADRVLWSLLRSASRSWSIRPAPAETLAPARFHRALERGEARRLHRVRVDEQPPQRPMVRRASISTSRTPSSSRCSSTSSEYAHG
jgi:hypothetical protein